MKKILLVVFILFCIVINTHAVSIPKNILYQDETYIIQQQGFKVWLEIGSSSSKSHSVVYTPLKNNQWRKTSTTDKGIYDEDIFFKKLPFPFGLLLSSDMVYINKIIYYPEEKASITYFNGPPFTFLRALLKKVKNV